MPNVDNVREKLLETRRKFDAAVGAKGKERFYSGCMAAAFTAGEIANRLGIINVPIEPVWEWAIELFSETRKSVQKATIVKEGSSYASVINQYWNEFIHQILVVQSGQTEVDNVLINQSVSKPVIGALKGRHEIKTQRLYLAVSDFVSWVAVKEIGRAHV